MQAVAKKAKEPGTSDQGKSHKKPGSEEAVVQREINPLWHSMATHTMQPNAVSPLSPPNSNSGKLTQSKPITQNKPTLQRISSECEQEVQNNETDMIQTKLTIGAPDDPYEKEADAVADKVMRMPESRDDEAESAQGKPLPSTLVQRLCADCSDGSEENIQTKGGSGKSHGSLDSVHDVVSSPGSGSPLSTSLRRRVESKLGADLSHVRVHSDSRSQQAAGDINAKAFTNKNNVYLGAGQSATDTELMAHEATHTVQQSGVSPASNNLVQKAKSKVSDPVENKSRTNSALPQSATGARQILGPLANDVSLRTGVSMTRPSILAESRGNDIAFAPNAPPVRSRAGQALLAHEAAHVIQQNQSGPIVSDEVAEHQADRAAQAVLQGGSVPDLGHAMGPLRFEAGYHQASLTRGMALAGFTDEEQEVAYMANWARDVSQAFVPAVTGSIGANATLTIVQLISQAKFGEMVTAEQLGMYDPLDHIDAPAGQINADFVQHGAGGSSIDLPHRGRLDTPVEDYDPGNIASMYDVDSSGVPAYINMSKQRIFSQAHAALNAGRTVEGLMHVGNFSHTVEDLFAHSNWVETAVGLLIQDGSVILTGEASDNVEQRMAEGEPPVETYASDVASHANALRPILMTGTFSGGDAGHDTLISIKSEAQNLIHKLTPFAEGGSDEKFWALALEILNHVDETAEDRTLGPIFANHVEEAISGLTGIATDKTEGLVGDAASMEHGLLRDIALFGAEQLNRGAHTATELGSTAWDSFVRQELISAVDMLGEHVSLAKIALYVKNGVGEIAGAWKHIIDAVKGFPDAIKKRLLPALYAAEKKFKKAMETLVQAAWNLAINALLDTIEAMVGQVDVAESNVGRKLENMKSQMEELRSRLINAITELAPGAEGSAVIAQLQSSDLETEEGRAALVGFAAEGNLSEALRGLAIADAAAVLEAAGEVTDTGTRIAQLEQLPEWAVAGPSHSQIGKDHADSPFFGVVFTMAAQADEIIMGLMADAWAERGDTAPAPGLEGDYTPPEAAGNSFNPVLDADAMEHDRQRAFLETRDLGETIVEEGHDEVRPVQQLAVVAERLWELQLAKPVLGRILVPLVNLLRRGATTGRIIGEVERIHHWLEESGDDVLLEPLEHDPGILVKGVIEAAIARIKALLGIEEEEDEENGEERSEAYFDSQIETLSGLRGRGEAEIPEYAPTVLDQDVANSSTAEELLFAELERVFAHPYDSIWWRPTLQAWCEANGERLADYIIERNEGRAHHH